MAKQLLIRYSKPNAFEIYYEGGGELPQVLTGRFTDRASAQKAIDGYLASKPASKPAKKVNDEDV